MKYILCLLAFGWVTANAQIKTDVQLKAQADTIKFEINPKSNTALRIGNMFNAIITNKLNVSNAKGYKEYRAKISQSSTSRPQEQSSFINEISNDTVAYSNINYRGIAYTRVSTGTYTVAFNYSPSATYYSTDLDISFNDAKIRLGNVISGGNGTINYQLFTFYSYDTAGNLADNIISNSNIYIRLYR